MHSIFRRRFDAESPPPLSGETCQHSLEEKAALILAVLALERRRDPKGASERKEGLNKLPGSCTYRMYGPHPFFVAGTPV